MTTNNPKAVQIFNESTSVEYTDILGQLIKLNPKTIREVIAIGSNITDKEVAVFMFKCKYLQMNPLAGDAYLVKYGDQANVITSVDFFLKRANNYPTYDGYETEFGMDGDDITATCRVWFKDRQRPVSVTVYMSEYNTGRSLWGKGGKPRTMLEKVAICQAHRRAFPDAFQGVYDEAEIQKQPAAQQEQKPVTMEELMARAKAVESPKTDIETQPDCEVLAE